MKPVKDKFSGHAAQYKQFRPAYPQVLIRDISALCRSREVAWDCGTGNGQVASMLANEFSTVYASDISRKQLEHAIHQKNIIYQFQRAEQTSYSAQSFDLITVAQAFHWFDQAAFNQEARRLLKPEGIIAIWGYDLIQIDADSDAIIRDFYTRIVGPYWDAERKFIDDRYKTILFDFEEISLKEIYEIKLQWTLDQLEGYLHSWSAVKNYMQKHDGHDPVSDCIKKMASGWPSKEREVTFPVFMRIGRNV